MLTDGQSLDIGDPGLFAAFQWMKLVLGMTASPLVSRARFWALDRGPTGSRARAGLLRRGTSAATGGCGLSGPKVHVGLLLSRT